MEHKIIVIGSANTDYVIHAGKMPKLGETALGSAFQINAGGKGLNQAIAIAKLNGSAAFLGAIGKDQSGEFLLNTLNENGVSFEGVITGNASTGVAMITVVNGDNFILLDSGANNELTPEVLAQKAHLIAQSDFCVMQLEIPTETVIAACAIASKCGTKVILNPAPVKPLPQSVYQMVDYLIPNEHEAELLTGIAVHDKASAIRAVRHLLDFGVKHVIITLGSKGCVYNCGSDICFADAVPTKAVDTTSAGDSFIGALVSKLMSHADLGTAIAYATKVASITVSRPGAAQSIPFADEVE